MLHQNSATGYMNQKHLSIKKEAMLTYVFRLQDVPKHSLGLNKSCNEIYDMKFVDTTVFNQSALKFNLKHWFLLFWLLARPYIMVVHPYDKSFMSIQCYNTH